MYNTLQTIMLYQAVMTFHVLIYMNIIYFEGVILSSQLIGTSLKKVDALKLYLTCEKKFE